MVVLVALLLVPQKIWRGKLKSGEGTDKSSEESVLVQGGHVTL